MIAACLRVGYLSYLLRCFGESAVTISNYISEDTYAHC